MMSGGRRLRSMNVADSERRPVLGPAGNNRALSLGTRKFVSKPLRKNETSTREITVGEEKKSPASSTPKSFFQKSHSMNVQTALHHHEHLVHSNLSLDASCSSDASSDSFHSRASNGKLSRLGSLGNRRKPYVSKSRSDGGSESLPPSNGLEPKKSCAWVTSNIDPLFAAFHNQEWGVPVHDDKKLFELLVFSGALAEITWPSILSKRHVFREAFADFDPIAVSKFNEKKILAPGSTAISLLSEIKIRAIIENARQISKVVDEFGSFDNYLWSFVNYKPIVSRFRYPRQVPVKTPKADAISKDLVKRGFRSVGPTVVYSFMQVAGLTNDHLVSCFRFQECVKAAEGNKDNGITFHDKKNDELMSEMSIAIDDISLSSE